MANMMQEGFAMLAREQKASCSREVIYKRGVNQVTVLAVDGSRELVTDDGSGVLDRFEVRDYLILTADLILDGSVVLPQKGDQILDGDMTYTVDAPDGTMVYQEDGAGERLVIHTWERDAG